MIRYAELSDIPRLIELGKEFISTTPRYRDAIVPNDEAIGVAMEAMIEMDHGLVLVCEVAGEVVGMFGAIRTFHPFSASSVMSELFWYVAPEHRGQGVKMLKIAESWGRHHGVERAIMVSPTKKVSRFYRKRGYERLEEQFSRKL